ncbi:hypothetical protein HYN59_02545 [Flavobacterium album]|uniref:Fibronectin type-III domain-containing protein n=1 Tax=Flavobacterium album TaxID=2175091 RepID=A0A2S1QUK9_9FLAO|nr:T9SS type A sorting domain-containing protein [Flavobacterium album]AWH84056.1 hypothetical protein HYN59_02545 [Flavobacterium album]
MNKIITLRNLLSLIFCISIFANAKANTIALPLDAPVATEATDITFHSFTAHWNEVAGADNYIIEISTSSDFSTILPGWNDWLIWGTSQEVHNLTGTTTYYYRVVAVSGNTFSAYSNIIEVTTGCGPFIYAADNIDEYCGVTTIGDLPLSLNDYHWYLSETGGEPLTAETVIPSGIIYYTNYYDNCESPRQPYLAQITIADTPVIEDNEVAVCHSGTVDDITPEGSGYKWYADAASGTALAGGTALANGTLYVSRVAGNCESERVAIMVEIANPAVPQGEQQQTFITGEALSDVEVTANDALVWYADEALTTELPATTALTDNTTYYAINQDGSCMSEPLAVTVSQLAGINEFGMQGVRAYPNPVNDIYTITYTEPISTLSVYNMLGQPLATSQNGTASVQVNMAPYAQGTYFIKLTSGVKAATLKVVKQ